MTRKTLGKKATSLLAASGIAAGGLGLAALPAQATVTGNTTEEVQISAEPSTGAPANGTIAANTDVTVDCQIGGEAVSGTYNSDQWARVQVDGQTGYISRAYLTITDPSGLGACDTAAEPAPAEPAPAEGTDTSAEREHVISRGHDWIAQGVPYSMEAWHGDRDGVSYRTDCSGFVAMAYGMDPNVNWYTENLVQEFHEINKEDLQPGDLVGNLGPGTAGADGHVVIFTGWTDDSKTSFHSIEQRGGDGAVESVNTWGDSFWNNTAYRYNGF